MVAISPAKRRFGAEITIFHHRTEAAGFRRIGATEALRRIHVAGVARGPAAGAMTEMLTSESAARKKWCPFARVDGSSRTASPGKDKASHAVAEQFRCIAGDCMFWREIHTAHMKAVDAKKAETQGYCGIAGKPESERDF